MTRGTKLCLLLVLIYTVIVGLFGVMIYVVQSDRQLTRRIFRQVRQCPFGSGIKYEVIERHLPAQRAEPATFLFSACLFGKVSDTLETYYLQPFIENIERVKMNMPEAQMRLYVTQALRDLVVPRVVDQGAQVFVVSPDSQGFEGTLWRFFPADEDLPFMSIDMDADVVVDPALVTMLRHWLNDSTKPFFLMRHVWSTILPITAGRLGCKPHAFPFNVKERVESYCDTNFGIDEAFLNKELWPHVKNRIEVDTPVTGEEAGLVAGLTVMAGLVLTSLYWSYTACETAPSAANPSRKASVRYPLGW